MATVLRKRKSLEQSVHTLTGGHEPVVTKDGYKGQLIRAMNWYNCFRDEKHFRVYIEHYVKNSPSLKHYAYAVSKASFLEIKSISVVAHLIERGQHIDIKETLRVLEELEIIGKKYKKVHITTKQAVGVPTTAPSIQERILDSARTHASEVDGQLDIYVQQKGNDFSMKSYLLGNQVSSVVAKKIGEMYKKQVNELEDAVNGKDPQLKEGYSNFSKVQLRKFLELVRQIVADCNQQVVTAKSLRKPKARKVKPASVVAAKMKPMKEFAPLKLKSIEPAKIIGSDELWVYVPATRKLTLYRGAHGGPLGVSGMSVTSYDIEKSETKTLRKPEEFFKGLNLGKRAMANAWKAITSKGAKPRARINDGMILLAAN